MAKLRRDANAAKRDKPPDPWADPLGWVEFWRHDARFPKIECIEWLRKEAHESWHHFEANIFQYRLNDLDTLAGARPLIVGERQIKIDAWFEIALRLSMGVESTDFYGIAEYTDHLTADYGPKVNASEAQAGTTRFVSHPILPSDDIDSPVFVDPVEFSDHPQGVFGCLLPCVIWLQALDDVLRRRQAFTNAILSAFEEVRLGHRFLENGEGLIARWLPLVRDNELSYKVIEGRPEIMSQVSDCCGDAVRNRRVYQEAEAVLSDLLIKFTPRLNRFHISVGDVHPVERMEVTLRPFNLDPWPVQWMRRDL